MSRGSGAGYDRYAACLLDPSSQRSDAPRPRAWRLVPTYTTDTSPSSRPKAVSSRRATHTPNSACPVPPLFLPVLRRASLQPLTHLSVCTHLPRAGGIRVQGCQVSGAHKPSSAGQGQRVCRDTEEGAGQAAGPDERDEHVQNNEGDRDVHHRRAG